MCLIISDFAAVVNPPKNIYAHSLWQICNTCTKNRQLHNACAYIHWQYPLWLTLNFPDLCICVYIRRVHPPVAHARGCRHGRKRRHVAVSADYVQASASQAADFVVQIGCSKCPIIGLSADMVSVAVSHLKMRRRFCETTPCCRGGAYPTPTGWHGCCHRLVSQ